MELPATTRSITASWRWRPDAGSSVPRFVAEVLPENRDMLAVFHDGFAAVTTAGRDEIDVEFATSSWRAAGARFEP